MKDTLIKFLFCIAICCVLSLIVVLVDGDFSIKNFANVGSYIGIVPIIMASGRLFGGGSNDALEEIEHQQRVIAAFPDPKSQPDSVSFKARLPAGMLFCVGLFWFVSMQVTHHFAGK